MVSDRYLKLISQSTSNLVYIFAGWVFVLNHLGPILAFWWPLIIKMVVSDRYLESISPNPLQIWRLYLSLECAEMIQFWATSTQWHRPNFGPPVIQKWLKLVVSDPLWHKKRRICFKHGRRTGYKSPQKFFDFLPCCLNFGPLVAISVLSFPLIRPQTETYILWCLVNSNFGNTLKLKF